MTKKTALLKSLDDVNNPKEKVLVLHATYDVVMKGMSGHVNRDREATGNVYPRADKMNGLGVAVASIMLPKSDSWSTKCDDAFMLTQSGLLPGGGAWWTNDKVTPLFEGDACRSTMVADCIKLVESGRVFFCKANGWEEITPLTVDIGVKS